MSRAYKNNIKLRGSSFGKERRREIARMTTKNSTPLPLPLLYKDIDESFRNWVDNELKISFEGEFLPTISMYSNQRFTEYLQTWEHVDENKNIILNFKGITRENNPKAGTIVGQTRNIPGEHSVLLKTVEAYDKNNRKYYIDYRMKQPKPIDFVYTVSLLTNKYELLNEFNLLVNEKFQAINCYIQPNGHYIPMKLNEISDESEYSLDNRRFYSQSYNITVMAYIITEDDFIVEERPGVKLIGYEGDKATYADIEEFPNDRFESNYEFVPIKLTVTIGIDNTSYKFIIDTDFQAENVDTQNVRHFKVFVNDEERVIDKDFKVFKNDEIKIKGVTKYNVYKESKININGYRHSKAQKKK